MKSIQIPSVGKVEIIDLPTPLISSEEVLIKINYVGFCGSDLNTFRGCNPLAKSSVIPGHEISGAVACIGESVPEGIFSIGMKVTVNPYTSCGKCSSCRHNRENACRDNMTLGVQRDGAMCEYIAVPWSKVIPTGGITEEHIALIEPMSVGFHAVDRGNVSDIDTVMVIGCGMIGIGAIVRANMRGAKVVAVDIDDEKLSLARLLGASYTINSLTDDIHQRLIEITDNNGPDVVIEAVGSPATYQMAVDEVAFTGRVVCIGYSKIDVSFHTKLFVQKELDIRGSRNANPSDFVAVAKYLQRTTSPIDELISKIIQPEEAEDTLSKWSIMPGRTFRILVKFN